MKKMTSVWHPNARLFAMHSHHLLFLIKAKTKAKNGAPSMQNPGPNAINIEFNDSMIQ